MFVETLYQSNRSSCSLYVRDATPLLSVEGAELSVYRRVQYSGQMEGLGLSIYDSLVSVPRCDIRVKMQSPSIRLTAVVLVYI